VEDPQQSSNLWDDRPIDNSTPEVGLVMFVGRLIMRRTDRSASTIQHTYMKQGGALQNKTDDGMKGSQNEATSQDEDT
jgi:hypothetical protein